MFMKKIMAMALVTTMAVGMVGCGGSGSATGTAPVTTTATESTATEATATEPSTSVSVSDDQPEPFPMAGQTGGYSYEIHEDYGYFQKSKEQGFWLDALEEDDSPLFIIINAGKETNDKLKAVVTDLTINGSSVEVTVDFVPMSDAEAKEADTPLKTGITIQHGAEHIRKVTVKTVDGTEVKRIEN